MLHHTCAKCEQMFPIAENESPFNFAIEYANADASYANYSVHEKKSTLTSSILSYLFYVCICTNLSSPHK